MENAALNQIAFQGTLYMGLLQMQISSRIVKVNRSFWSVAALHFYILFLCALLATCSDAHVFAGWFCQNSSICRSPKMQLFFPHCILVSVAVHKIRHFSRVSYLSLINGVFILVIVSKSSLNCTFQLYLVCIKLVVHFLLIWESILLSCS